MKSIAMFLLFLGIILIINGIYEQKFESLKKNVKIEYRFIPRTYYEEQLSQNADVTSNYKNMFQGEIDPWFDRNVTIAPPPRNSAEPSKS
jgi:hypothetical protein